MNPSEPTGQPEPWKVEYSKYSTYCNIIDSDGYVGTIRGREKAELAASAPQLRAEVERQAGQLMFTRVELTSANVELEARAEEIKRNDKRIAELEAALSRCSECNDLATSREYAKTALNGKA